MSDYKKHGLRAVLERIVFTIYNVSILPTVVPLYYFAAGTLLALKVGLTPEGSQTLQTLLEIGLFSLVVFLTLLHVGYKHLHFKEHENILETDELLDFKDEELLERFVTLKEILSDVDTKSKLDPFKRKMIRDEIERMIDDVKQENESIEAPKNGWF